MPLISVSVEGLDAIALLDTEAGLSLCTETLFKDFNVALEPPKYKVLVVDGRGIAMLGSAIVNLQFCGVTREVVFHIVPTLPTNYSIIIGVDLLHKFGVVIDCRSNSVRLNLPKSSVTRRRLLSLPVVFCKFKYQ